jgi:hypothetical protein
MVTVPSLTWVFNGMQDFGMAMKILKIAYAVANQQPFEHLT